MFVYWLLAGLVSGILAAHYIGELFLLYIFSGVFLLLLAVRWKKLAVFAFFLSLGFACTLLRTCHTFAPVYGQGREYTVKSHRLMVQGEDYYTWQAKVVEPKNLAGATILINSRSYNAGIYCLRGTLYPPVQYRNPGQKWHYLRKIYAGEIGVLNNPQITHSREYNPGLVEGWRHTLRRRIVTNMGDGEAASLALALIAGDRSLLGVDLRTSVYLTGIGHILALSGLHISILTGLMLLALKALGLSRRVALLIGMGLLFFYLVLVGPSPSLIRAVLMSAYATAALLARREKLGLPALLWSVAVMLLYNPLWLFDYAFVFSFLATFVCLTVGQRLERHLTFLPELVARTASITVIIQAIAMPLTIYLFNSFSLLSPLANMVIVPLMPMMAGFSLLAGLPGTPGRILSIPAGLLLSGVAEFVKLLAETPISISLGGFYLVLLTWVSAMLLLFLTVGPKRSVTRMLAIGMIFCCLWLIVDGGTTSAWILDVGQGDAILLRNRGSWILVDCGDSNAGERAVVPALKSLGVRRLQAVIVTHPHEDHAGGLAAVLSHFAVENILVNANFADSRWQEIAPTAQLVRGTFTLANNIQIHGHGIPIDNENDGSLVVSLATPGGTLLLPGDLEEEGEKLLRYRLSRHQILKVPHHGSSSSSHTDFLRLVKPEVAVISCGLGNKYGFPHADTLERLNASSILRTDVDGCVGIIFWPWQRYTITTFMGR